MGECAVRLLSTQIARAIEQQNRDNTAELGQQRGGSKKVTLTRWGCGIWVDDR